MRGARERLAPFDIDHAEGGVVQRQLRKRGAAHQLMRHERWDKHVPLERQAALQVRIGPDGARHTLQTDRRLVVAPGAPAFEVVGDAAIPAPASANRR